jgi:hypothetical protein
MVARGAAHRLWANGPGGAADTEIGDRENISELRVKLLQDNHELAQPKSLTVTARCIRARCSPAAGGSATPRRRASR